MIKIVTQISKNLKVMNSDIHKRDGLVKKWKIIRYPKQLILACNIKRFVSIIPLIELPLVFVKKLSKYSTNELQQWASTLKRQCACCGETDPIVLVFHHRNPKNKRYNISAMTRMRFCKKQILEEVAKCVILCCNCHIRIHTFERDDVSDEMLNSCNIIQVIQQNTQLVLDL